MLQKVRKYEFHSGDCEVMEQFKTEDCLVNFAPCTYQLHGTLEEYICGTQPIHRIIAKFQSTKLL